tara:strand:- start:322 stop:429 length:108 start_codon:yes stop_codon:yes gene_type:complete
MLKDILDMFTGYEKLAAALLVFGIVYGHLLVDMGV